MSEKKKLRFSVEKANRIDLQMAILEELGKNPMNSAKLRELIEGMGGCYELILPILKKAKLIKAERNGTDWVYSLNSKVKEEVKSESQSSINYFVKFGNPSKIPVFSCRVKFPVYEVINTSHS
jgi:hypothetical protein